MSPRKQCKSRKPRRPAPRYRRWFVESLEDRSAPSESLLLLGALAAAVQAKPPNVSPGALSPEVTETAPFAPTRGTNALSISRAAPAPNSEAPPPRQETLETEAADQIFTTEFVNLAAELSLGTTAAEDNPTSARSPARPLSMPSGTNTAPAPGGTAGSSGSGGGGGGGAAGVDGAAAAMAASASAASAAPATSAHSTTTASAVENSGMRTSLSPAGYIPPPPVANDDDLDTYHDTQLVETDPGIVANDDPNIQSCVLDTGPSMGQISNWDGQGGFTYTPNYHVYGTDTFTYHNVDYYGQSSNEATVTIHVVENAPEALPDGTYWGDWNKLSTTGNTITVDSANGVLANDTDQDGPDSGNLQAVKDSDPANGTVTLNPDGSFIYTPNPGFGGYDQFTYHATDGILNSATVAVLLAVQKVDLDMWDGGPDAQVVPDAQENTRGAYAVTNLNDTNGDGTPDALQNPVVATLQGRNEVDLMRLQINEPVPWKSGDTLELDYSNGLSLWTSPTKTAQYPSANGVASITTDNWPVTLWVEADAVSKSLRDMSVSAQYNGGTDSVDVTGVWADLTATEAATKSAADVLAEFPDMIGGPVTVVNQYGGTGVRPINATNQVHSLIVMQFTIEPSRVKPDGSVDGSWEQDGVNFDITRQIKGQSWVQAVAGGAWDPVPPAPGVSQSYPSTEEYANDDSLGNAQDESPTVIAATGHFYVEDSPGLREVADGGDNGYTFMRDFREFVRVAIDAPRPSGNGVLGSRASDYYPWHMFMNVGDDGSGNWKYVTDGTYVNEIDTGNPVIPAQR